MTKCTCRPGAHHKVYAPGAHHDTRCAQYKPITDRLDLSVTLHKKPPALVYRNEAIVLNSEATKFAAVVRQKGIVPEWDRIRIGIESPGFHIRIEGDRPAFERLREALCAALDGNESG